MKNLYQISLGSACALDKSMDQTYDDGSKFLSIRTEMNWFFMNLAYSQQTDIKGQQIHYLFLALEHLNNVEREIRVSDVDEQIIRLERIFDKICSLKKLVLEYIRHLGSQD